MAFLAILAFNFHSDISKALFLAIKCISHAKYEKSLLIMPNLFFFHNIGPNVAQIMPLRPHPLSFFFWFPMKYVGGFN